MSELNKMSEEPMELDPEVQKMINLRKKEELKELIKTHLITMLEPTLGAEKSVEFVDLMISLVILEVSDLQAQAMKMMMASQTNPEG